MGSHFRWTRPHQAQWRLTGADIGQTALQEQLNGALDRYARDSRLPVYPAVGIEIGVLRTPQFREVGSWAHFEPWLWKISRARCRNIGRSGGYGRFMHIEVMHHYLDADKNCEARQQHQKNDGKQRRNIHILFLMMATFSARLHAGTATANRGSFSGTSGLLSRFFKNAADQIPPIPTKGDDYATM